MGLKYYHGMNNLNMKYLDKNGSEWSIDKGDWLGSFNKDNSKKKKIIFKFSIPFLLIVILSLILLS